MVVGGGEGGNCALKETDLEINETKNETFIQSI